MNNALNIIFLISWLAVSCVFAIAVKPKVEPITGNIVVSGGLFLAADSGFDLNSLEDVETLCSLLVGCDKKKMEELLNGTITFSNNRVYQPVEEGSNEFAEVTDPEKVIGMEKFDDVPTSKMGGLND